METQRRVIEFARLQAVEDWILYGVGFALVVLAVALVYRRDARRLSPVWRYGLLGLRVLVLLALLAILLEPQERVEHTEYESSRVVVLVDQSLSMSLGQGSGVGGLGSVSLEESRYGAAVGLLSESDLLRRLRQHHEVHVYAFGDDLQEVAHLPRVRDGTRPASENAASAHDEPEDADTPPPEGRPPTPNWSELLEPRGAESRVGEAIAGVFEGESLETLSGVLLVSDGAANGGLAPEDAVALAEEASRPVFAFGLGSTEEPVNLRVMAIQAPARVHPGDALELVAMVQATGPNMLGRQVSVELYVDDGSGTAALVESRTVEILSTTATQPVAFEYLPGEPGELRFSVRIEQDSQELVSDDNERTAVVDVHERDTRVLLFAGGPTRDYQFLRNLLYRDRLTELSVYLQTGQEGISQEADHVLARFPSTREEMLDYDVVVAFDPDWERLTPEQIQVLADWVRREAGGLVLVAGPVYTDDLAASEGLAGREHLELVRELYPVLLQRHVAGFGFEPVGSAVPRPLARTPAGMRSPLLDLEDDAAASDALWRAFPGVYGCYPTRGAKAGAAVLVQTAGDDHVLLATHYYGLGPVLYVGSGETWRLRAIDEAHFDHFWVQGAIQYVGQGRLLRDTSRGVLLVESEHYPVGSTVRVHARLLDAAGAPLEAESVRLTVRDPQGPPFEVELRHWGPARREARPPGGAAGGHRRDAGATAGGGNAGGAAGVSSDAEGTYVGQFDVRHTGLYELQLVVPDTDERMSRTVQVELPNREFERPQQDVQLLRAIARRTGGEYFSEAEAVAESLPELLPDRSRAQILSGVPEPLWDQSWVMFALVGVLAVEWLVRKLLKLA